MLKSSSRIFQKVWPCTVLCVSTIWTQFPKLWTHDKTHSVLTVGELTLRISVMRYNLVLAINWKFQIISCTTQIMSHVHISSYGSTAVLVHLRIVHCQVYTYMSFKSTSIKISLANENVGDIRALKSEWDWFVIVGDLNAKHPLWHSHHANTERTLLHWHILQNDYTIVAPAAPTFFPNRHDHRPDMIDIAFFKLLQFLTEVFNIKDLSSNSSENIRFLGQNLPSTFFLTIQTGLK